MTVVFGHLRLRCSTWEQRQNGTTGSCDFFTVYQRPVGYEMRDLTITVGDDVAFAHSLNRVTGTLKNGNGADYWVRWTACFRKIDGTWLIAHDHVSVPLDVASGRALLDLKP